MEKGPSLSTRQKEVLSAVQSGKNIFVTGPPGTGKSTIIKELQKLLVPETLCICSSTGISAIAVGGGTLHSFAGIGLGQDSVPSLCAQMSKIAKERWRKTKQLIIDEISMISGELFDKIEQIARVIRVNDKPFGGIQLMIFGDFYQLPAVKADKYAFEAESWKRCIDQVVQLDQVFRQNDPTFIQLLSEMRVGQCSEHNQALLKNCEKTELKTTQEGIVPTKLYPHRKTVERENNLQLSLLKTESVLFEARDTGRSLQQLKDCPAPVQLIIKKGAQVILLKNLDTKLGLGNGTRGVVSDFTNPRAEALQRVKEAKDEKAKKMALDDVKREEHQLTGKSLSSGILGWLPVVTFENGMIRVLDSKDWTVVLGGEMVARRDQIPLNLAYALTIHRCQGQTLSSAEINLNGTFTTGQAYVAISRLRSLEGLKLIGFKPEYIQTDMKVLNYYNNLPKSSTDSKLKRKLFESEEKEQSERSLKLSRH